MSRNPWLREYRPLSVAHRGHSIAYPENTLEAYRKAIELGVEMIECDVNITRDGKLVMIHDSMLDRTTTGSGLVSAATWEEIQGLDAGGKFKPEFAGARIPSTEETLLLYKEAGIFSCRRSICPKVRPGCSTLASKAERRPARSSSKRPSS